MSSSNAGAVAECKFQRLWPNIKRIVSRQLNLRLRYLSVKIANNKGFKSF